ncbi:MAG TPA: helix-turn-helix domain-containing GNAT family N-acetyltransferase [Vicinamibacterales bacterium]|nr:helix-turn-helix domain-containing GNAT family N-acetyltransferase [Vicinamibacterales bacterium]
MEQHVDAVRAFNRFYTREIGVLGERHLQSPFSLTEMRVLYELAHRDGPAAAELGRDLGLDAGYLSRILRRFESRGLIGRSPSPADARQSLLHLTRKGRAAFGPLEARARGEVETLLARVGAGDRGKVVDAMSTIARLLGEPREDGARAAPYLLRAHQPGDMGWVIHRHGALYAQEWGYNQEFEALVARICADFLDHFDPSGERCWIAERDGAIVGSVFLVRKSKTVAKLRLLLVEPSARGLGIGRRLIEECIRFARQAGYRKLTLWTQSDLDAARRLYQQAGFRCVQKKPHDSFGRKHLIAETWDLAL